MNITSRRLISILAVAGAVVLLIVCIPLATQTMRAPGVDCGTVFSSSDTWTYSSNFDASDTSSYYDGARTDEDLQAGAEAAISDMFADMNRGSAAYDYCMDRHSDRRILLISLGCAALVLAAIGAGILSRDRRSSPPARETDLMRRRQRTADSVRR